MYRVELYLRIRMACMVDGMSIKKAAQMFGLCQTATFSSLNSY